jgi:hypothetical protein
MEIIIMQKWCHPEFGGTRTSTKKFTMAQFLEAEGEFKRLSEGDCAYQHTSIFISHEFPEPSKPLKEGTK